MNKKRKNIIILITISILLLLLFFSIILFFIVIFRKSIFSTSEEDIPKSNFLEHSEISIKSLNHTSSGFAHIRKKLSNNEYISYPNPTTGNLVILSNFGGEKYECTGSCYCLSSTTTTTTTNRRIGSIINNSIQKGLLIVLTALTAHTALQLAKDSFKKNCEQEFPFCETRQLKLDLDGCQALGDDEEDDEEEMIDGLSDPTVEHFTKTTKKKKKKKSNFWFECTGHCVRNNRVKEPEALDIMEKKFSECESLNLLREVSIPATHSTAKAARITALHEFKAKFLIKYCKAMSKFYFEYERDEFSFTHLKDVTKRREKLTFACSARLYDSHIKCVRKKGLEEPMPSLDDLEANDELQ